MENSTALSHNSDPCGALVVDKPTGPTSHDVVAQARRLYRTRRVGHTGTLDPMASGAMVLLFGEATKLSQYLSLQDKRYRAKVAFGMATDSYDALGAVTRTQELSDDWLESAHLQKALEQERIRTAQVPPIFSAIKVEGERSHRLARRGEAIELAPRAVAVRQLRLLECDARSLTVELTVSKGYYVRSFAQDIGQHLGVPSHLQELRRLSSGPFDLQRAAPWPATDRVPLLSLEDAARMALPCAQLTETGAERARHGKALSAADFEALPPSLRTETAESGQVPPSAWFHRERLLAIGQLAGADSRVLRGFVP